MNRTLTLVLRLVAVCGILTLVPATLAAQRGARGRQAQVPPQGRELPPDQRLGQMMRTQLQLTDAQVPKLQETNRRFMERRVALNEEERQARTAMRDGLCSGDSSRSADVSRAIDQMIDIQKRRVQMLDDEQRELSGFLSPFQRARYLGVAERLVDAMGGRGAGGRGGRMGQPPGGPPGGPPNGPPNGGRPNGLPMRGQGGAVPPDVCAMPGPPPNGARGGLRARGRGGI